MTVGKGALVQSNRKPGIGGIPGASRLLFTGLLLPTLLSVAVPAGPSRLIDPEKSVLTVRVFKTGMLSAFGHEHEIRAPIEQGSFSTDPPEVEIRVDARKLRVVDKDISDSDRVEVQQAMLGPKVLDSQQFPEIRFQATGPATPQAGQWTLHGQLTVRGQTRPVEVVVQDKNGHYVGASTFKQRDFGIIPVSGGGGTVKTKDELRVEFDVVEK